jgi:hypothetical protein
MSTDPKSIHDALRRLTVLIGSTAIDVNAFIDEPGGYSAGEFFEPVALALHDAQVLLRWIRDELKEKYE